MFTAVLQCVMELFIVVTLNLFCIVFVVALQLAVIQIGVQSH